MEATKKSSRKAAHLTGDQIKEAYVEYLLTEARQPASIFSFCKDLGIKEQDFYQFFGSFDAIESEVWKSILDTTTARLEADESFAAFSSREKVLAFYFTLLEEMKAQRSFVVMQLKSFKKLELTPSPLKVFKVQFELFFERILLEGKASGQVAARPFLDKRYPQLFWLHLSFVLRFWQEDGSPGFEQTDAAVEKSVNLAFDLIGKGAIDSAIDFAKFMYQNKK